VSDKPQLPRFDSGSRALATARRGTRSIYIAGAKRQVPVLDRDRMPTGEASTGPVLVEEGGATTLVPAGWSVELDRVGCLVMRRS
jgi:N-methylhydantoinase A/oxoprolinase/acetone carboxylase beta subunit